MLNVFVIGDCILVMNELVVEIFYVLLVNNVVWIGLVVVNNLEEKIYWFIGFLWIMGIKVGDYYFVIIGLIEMEGLFFL